MFAATKGSSAGVSPQVFAFNGGVAGDPEDENLLDITSLSGGNGYDITIDAETGFYPEGTIGLGDVIIFAVCGLTGTSVTSTDFTSIYTSGGTLILWAVYNGSDLTLNVNTPNDQYGNNTSFHWHYYSVRYADTSSPFDVSISTTSYTKTSNGTYSVTSPSVTTSTDNSIIFSGYLFQSVGNNSPLISPSTLSNFLDVPSNMEAATNQGFGAGASYGDPTLTYTNLFSQAAYKQQTTAGSFTPNGWGSFTLYFTPSQKVYGITYTLAIKPAP
jgi:hypothetical protein